MFHLLKYLHKKEWFLYILLIFLLLIQVFLTVLIPVQISFVTGLTAQPTPPSGGEIATKCSLLVTYVVLLSGLVVITSYLSNHITSKFALYIRHEAFIKVNKLSSAQINKISIPSIIWRATSEVDYLQNIIGQLMVLIITAPGSAIGGLLTMWLFPKQSTTSGTGTTDSTPWQFVVMTVCVIFIMVTVAIASSFLIIPKIRQQQKDNDSVNRQTREAITGIRVINAFDSLEFHATKFNKSSNSLKKNSFMVEGLNAINGPVTGFVTSCLTIGIYWLGAYLIRGGAELSYPTLIGLATLTVTIVNGFLMGAVLVIIFPQMQVSVKRLREILDAKILIKDGDEKNIDFVGKGTLEFKNVNYKFTGAKENILSDISFKAHSGEFIGIIGATGSGKTTLMNLIPRFSDPSEGQILIDGVDTKKMKLSTLRNKVGYSQQKANLLNRSISDNIGLQYSEPTNVTSTRKIELASEVSQSRVFIENLENKYATIIAQNATNVSGGQKQRISIARTIVDHPEIMLFDDSFSALDYATDLKLRRELFEIYKDSTKIVVASRIATIIKANKIIVLDDGKIVETGTHKELFKNSPLYRNIVLSQMTEKEATNG